MLPMIGIFRPLDLTGAQDGVGPFGGLAKALSDGADVFQNLLQPRAKIVLADVFFDQGVGIGGDVVEGSGDFAANIVGDLVAGADALDYHQIENVQRNRHISAEDFRELPVVLIERGPLAALDVEDADDLVVQAERDGQAALGASSPTT